ncbi:MAG: endonuclease/exonuclease/phosphatase family protein [Proteobacteria bacterium]|nr:endonuclease/exonuclease/phosphatase family protein [Pseudomonadota bacterium]
MRIFTCFFLGLVIFGFLIPLGSIASSGENTVSPECQDVGSNDVITSPLLSLVTLNLAHGRKEGLNQMLQKTSTTRRNLEDIANFLSDSGADLIALQEADSPSLWSGKFNHVDFVAEMSHYPCKVHAHHATKQMYDFGTALLSRVPYIESLTHTFAPSPPTTNKGFVLGKVLWNPNGELSQPVSVSIISVHLDFSRKSVREAQIEEMRAMLADIATPLVILGDFNTDWTTDASALKHIVEKADLRVYQTESNKLGTYKKGKHRLDWILISKDLEFVSYAVPQLILSDHQPVTASIRLVNDPSIQMDSSKHGQTTAQ